MNRIALLAATAAALISSSAFAGGEFDPLTGFGPVGQSTVTRAQVQAELTRSRAANDVVEFDRGAVFAQAPKGTGALSRDDVKTEFARARSSGELVSFDTGTQYVQAPKVPSTLTREQVREETRLAVKQRQSVAAGS